MEFSIPSKQRIPLGSEGMMCYATSSTEGRSWSGRTVRPHDLRGALICVALLAYLLVAGGRGAQAQSLLEASRRSSIGWRPSRQDPNAISNADLSRVLRSRAGQGLRAPDEPNEVGPPDLRERQPIREGPSQIELLLSGRVLPDVCDVSLDLKQFGYSVFREPVTTFAPVTNVPVGPDYVIGPGDSFTLTLWGRVDAQYPLRVDRNGQIILPEVGALKVWGMTFGELDGYLRHELSRKHTDFKMSVAMDRLRTITIYVVGDALTPGSYTVSSLSTVINGLFAAGGPSKNGSLRTIRLLRAGEDPVVIDLYDFLFGGDRSGDIRLQDGDRIHIPLIGPVVAVAGNVKRPAIYEMAEPMTLSAVLDLAGGITFAGWLQRVQVERVANHQRRIAVDFDMSQDGTEPDQPAAVNATLQDGDVVKVFAVPWREERVVYVEGHVVRPGKYEWAPGMRLMDLLPSYEALQPQPNVDYAEIERLVPPDLHPTVVSFNLGRLLAGDESNNLELAQYDTVRVFRWDEQIVETVTVSGMVFDPNAYRLVPEMRVSDLVSSAGGLRKNAYVRTAEITRRHVTQEGMTTEKIEIDLEKALLGDREHDVPLRDHDYLVVRPIPELAFDRTADVTGEVRFPGTYPIRRGETLSSLIERAGGYTEKAYLKGAVFTRESAKGVQRRRLDQLIRQIEESVLAGTEEAIGGALDAETIRGQQAALGAKRELLAKLRSAEITGRVVVKLAPLAEFTASQYDMELEHGDVLTVPQMPGVVHVVGEVFNPTSLLYEEGRTVSYYLRRVGGLTKEADKKQLSVIKADGSVVSTAQRNRGRLVFWDSGSKSWFFGGFMNLEMEPGDAVVVPRKLDRLFWLKTTKDITQIIFQIAVAAGVVFAI